MKSISTFLESSTIHGLNYISTTRKYARVFWILVVFSGFTGAGYLIQTSFQSWADSPIKTTIETLPIDEIKFPKVTVCPPKNTYTDLNDDLMLAENFTLTDEMRDELTDYSYEVIHEHVFMDDLDTLQEDDRYYNWSYGYSKIQRSLMKDSGLNYLILTSATSGVVNTQYFGEQYQPNLVDKNVYFEVYIFPPKSVKKNPNVTLHFDVEKVSMIDLYDGLGVNGNKLEAEQTFSSVNFTPPADTYAGRYVDLTRNIINEELTNIEMELMPGFRLSWHYTGLEHNVEPDSQYSESQENQLFIW